MKNSLLFLLLLFCFQSLKAQIFVKQDATGANNGTSWTNAFINLQNALDSAQPGEQIWVSSGSYIPNGVSPQERHFNVLIPVELYGGFSGTESSFDQRDPQINLTILNGDVNGNDVSGNFTSNRQDNAHHILLVDAGNQLVRVDGFIFKGGMTRVDAYAPEPIDINGIHRWRGGAMFIYDSPTIISQCVFQDNYGYDASAIMAKNLDYTSPPVIIENTKFLMNGSINGGTCNIWPWTSSQIKHCTFEGNISGNRGAGLGIYNSGALVENCSFDDNFSSVNGGACSIWNTGIGIDHPDIQFKGCEFNDNSASNVGGAIQLICYSLGFDLSIDSCKFDGNYTVASGAAGGAIYVIDKPDTNTTEATNHIWINKTIFSNNTSNYGGAMEIDGGDDSLRIDIQHTQFITNSSVGSNDTGGAVYIWQPYSGKTKTMISHSLFKENTSATYGGGLIFSTYLNDFPLSYTIAHTDFNLNNSYNAAGAIWSAISSGPANHGFISDCNFDSNVSQIGGAILSAGELAINRCHFTNNSAIGNDPEFTSAGGIHIFGSDETLIQNSFFDANSSEVDAAAIVISNQATLRGENLVFQDQLGPGTIRNESNMMLTNCTLVNNENGIIVEDSSQTTLQNSIFQNSGEHLHRNGNPEIQSYGGNISSDNSMATYLTGYGGYQDLHNTNPLLGADLVPLSGSPCIDEGNPDGLLSTFDLAGNPRIYGNNIDIGAFESFLVSAEEIHSIDPGFIMSPNPASDFVNIEFDNHTSDKMDLSITNMVGQPVLHTSAQKAFSKHYFTLPIGEIPKGEYIISVSSGGKIFAQKLIIQ